ncbi:MAG: hypothetical protein ACLQUY_10140 [Ktedonobacterales bacterium]
MTTRTGYHAHRSDDGDLTPLQRSLLQLAEVRNVSGQDGDPTDLLVLCARGYLCSLGCSADTPLTASLGERFTITAAGLDWLRKHGLRADYTCRCRVCTGHV